MGSENEPRDSHPEFLDGTLNREVGGWIMRIRFRYKVHKNTTTYGYESETKLSRRLPEKHRVISRKEKMAFSTPPPPSFGLPWGSPPHPPESVRPGGRTLTSEPNFLASIGNQICLTMVLSELCHLLNGVNGVVNQDSCFRSCSTCNPPRRFRRLRIRSHRTPCRLLLTLSTTLINSQVRKSTLLPSLIAVPCDLIDYHTLPWTCMRVHRLSCTLSKFSLLTMRPHRI